LTGSINIAPVKFSNITVLNRVIEELRHRFALQINVIELMLDIENAYYSERSQYYSTQILADAIEVTGSSEAKILILTEVDIFIPVLTFVFGEAQLKGTHSIVSACRLHEEFYSGISNDELLFERIMKEIMQLKETEKQLNDTRDKEKKAYEEAHKNNKKKIEMLTESLNKKEAEITDLKMALIELNEKETQRMMELEKEADQFKKIINKK